MRSPHLAVAGGCTACVSIVHNTGRRIQLSPPATATVSKLEFALGLFSVGSCDFVDQFDLAGMADDPRNHTNLHEQELSQGGTDLMPRCYRDFTLSLKQVCRDLRVKAFEEDQQINRSFYCYPTASLVGFARTIEN
jgi:hypothetical protein